MRILILGASGVLGHALLSNLDGHEIWALTRSPAKLAALQSRGVQGSICDVYDHDRMEQIALEFLPELIVNFLTDLSSGPGPGNSRIRQEIGPVVARIASRCGARGLAIESVAFDLPDEAGRAVRILEQSAIDSGVSTWLLRFARLFGPGTWLAAPQNADAISTADAGRYAAQLILHA